MGRTLAAATDEQVIRYGTRTLGDVKATLTGHTDAGAAVCIFHQINPCWRVEATIVQSDCGILPPSNFSSPFQNSRIVLCPLHLVRMDRKLRVEVGGEVYISDLATGKSIATLTGLGEWFDR